jgi:anti-sigma regulatory factor (Ser/Thr protein kinase)
MNNNTIQLHELMLSRGTFFCYAGPLSEDVLTSLSGVVKEQLTETDSTSPITNKVFSIFVEQAQNIIRYSGDRMDKSGVGSVSISASDDGFLIEAVNEIKDGSQERLEGILTDLKNMDAAELKAAYKQRLKSGPPEGSVGAGLGFIEVARRSARLDFCFEPPTNVPRFLDRGWVDTPR